MDSYAIIAVVLTIISAMASFDLYAPTLKRWEGGWVNDPDDKGGATMCGVTLGTFRMYFGAERTAEELRNISDAQWKYIMKRYWDNCKADQIENQSIAEIFVDWHVNAGTSAIRRTQSAFGIKSDGKVGRQTLSVLNGKDSSRVFDMLKNARISYYNKLAMTTPVYKKFLRGWLNRVNSFIFHP